MREKELRHKKCDTNNCFRNFFERMGDAAEDRICGK